MKYEIKELTQNIINESFLHTLENLSKVGDMNLEDMKRILSEINKQNSYVFIAQTNEGKIIGTITLLVEQKFIHRGGKVGHIEDVATREGYEGKGVGGCVVKRAIEKAKELGCYKIILDCKDDLIPFYEGFGFRKFENCMGVDL